MNKTPKKPPYVWMCKEVGSYLDGYDGGTFNGRLPQSHGDAEQAPFVPRPQRLCGEEPDWGDHAPRT
ncbi:hypothetical protein SBA2_360063 [Acidobacteriia bacterium SbA2]|nr:hypothetical protein SBA2_360063 [Acidobacteriia bacterium SbA2]